MYRFLRDERAQTNPASFVYFEPLGESRLWYKKELAGRHGAKLRCRQRRQLFLQALKVAVRTVSLPAARGEPEPSPPARQREMRAESMLLLRDPSDVSFSSTIEAREFSFDPRLNPNPEYSGRQRTRKKTIAAKVHFERAAAIVCQCLLDFLNIIAPDSRQ